MQDVPIEDVQGELLCVDRVAEGWIYLLISTEDNNDLVTVCIQQEVLLTSLKVPMQQLTMAFPCFVVLKKKGSEAVQLTVLHE